MAKPSTLDSPRDLFRLLPTPPHIFRNQSPMIASTWSLRSLMSPVITRLLIFGVNPMDLEGVMSRLELQPLVNSKMLETRWLAEWQHLADIWKTRAHEAQDHGHYQTAQTCFFHASTCSLARFLVNTADLDIKRSVYQEYASNYRLAVNHTPAPVRSLEISCLDDFCLAAQLHMPVGDGPFPCAVVFAGLGSCKEEMHTLARALADRGVAALVPDMPGCGATLFDHHVPCSMSRIELAIKGLANAVEDLPELRTSSLGAVGLCMGGGYAFRAAAIDPRYRHAATLFPLFINMVDPIGIPQWMRSGPWMQLQTGSVDSDQFIASMGPAISDAPRVPFLVVHGRHDNWMTWDSANALLDRVEHPRRDLITIESPAMLTAGNATTHAMPVGEQMHWVAPLVADWIRDRVDDLESA